MDVLFSTGSLTGFTLSSIFDIARRVGADGIELMLTGQLLRQDPSRVQELERTFGVPVRAIHTVMRLGRVSPERAASDIVMSAAYANQFVRCHALVVHGPETHSLHTGAARTWLSALETACEMTEHSSINIALENPGRLTPKAPPTVLDHPDRLRWLAQEWGVAITYDTSHAASQQWDVLGTATKLAPQLANVHLSDYHARSYRSALANAFLRDHQLPGAGMLPLEALLAGLSAAQYRGVITLELSPVSLRVPWRPTTERLLKEAIDFCRAALARPQPSKSQTRYPDLP